MLRTLGPAFMGHGDEPDPVLIMQVVGDASAVPEVVEAALPRFRAEGVEPTSLERFALCHRARVHFAIRRSQVTRPYGSVTLRNGVDLPVNWGCAATGSRRAGSGFATRPHTATLRDRRRGG